MGVAPAILYSITLRLRAPGSWTKSGSDKWGIEYWIAKAMLNIFFLKGKRTPKDCRRAFNIPPHEWGVLHFSERNPENDLWGYSLFQKLMRAWWQPHWFFVLFFQNYIKEGWCRTSSFFGFCYFCLLWPWWVTFCIIISHLLKGFLSRRLIAEYLIFWVFVVFACCDPDGSFSVQ